MPSLKTISINTDSYPHFTQSRVTACDCTVFSCFDDAYARMVPTDFC